MVRRGRGGERGRAKGSTGAAIPSSEPSVSQVRDTRANGARVRGGGSAALPPLLRTFFADATPSSGALHPLRRGSNLPACHGAVSRGVPYEIGYAQRAARRCHPDNVARYHTQQPRLLHLDPVRSQSTLQERIATTRR